MLAGRADFGESQTNFCKLKQKVVILRLTFMPKHYIFSASYSVRLPNFIKIYPVSRFVTCDLAKRSLQLALVTGDTEFFTNPSGTSQLLIQSQIWFQIKIFTMLRNCRFIFDSVMAETYIYPSVRFTNSEYSWQVLTLLTLSGPLRAVTAGLETK